MTDATVLEELKIQLGIHIDNHDFDKELIMLFNSGLAMLSQIHPQFDILGRMENETTTWIDILGDEPNSMVRQYLYIKVKLLFDPPNNSSVTSIFQEELKEIEQRISYEGGRPIDS